MQEQIETAWAAGLFDGEGCVRVDGMSSVQATLGLTDLPLLQRYHAAVGGRGAIGAPEHRPGRSTFWRWQVCASSAVEVAELLLPYVGPRNQRRFEALRSEYAANKQGTCEHCGRVFARGRRDGRYCTKNCGRWARRGRERATLPPERRAFLERKSVAALRAQGRSAPAPTEVAS